ncbi:hypothetical protein HHI36_021997 [Cryptolaemus montrouzieri]|uniref:Carbohydrate sulfotransferase n=1 Tax=Cryptolaemus montrouzieri TaxID=559131 RepID=A0ABD2MYE4_9CUCU
MMPKTGLSAHPSMDELMKHVQMFQNLAMVTYVIDARYSEMSATRGTTEISVRYWVPLLIIGCVFLTTESFDWFILANIWMGDLDKEIENLTHEDLLEITQSSLKRLIAADSLLKDLPFDVTTDEVLSQVAVVQGQSITVTILRHSESPLNVVIPQQGATVKDLKQAIQRCFALKQQRSRIKTKISWKYVWKAYSLQHEGMTLKRNCDLVSKYGVTNRSELRFVKRGILLLFLIKDVNYVNCTNYPWLEQIARQETLTRGCSKVTPRIEHVNTTTLDHILVDHKHKMLYCYVPKVACTNWKRVMMVLTGASNATNLIDIPSYMAHAENSTLRLSDLPPNEAKRCLKSYTSFLMVRHPMERLLSAFRNKFEGNLTSSRYFQARYGKHIIKKYRWQRGNKMKIKQPLGSDVTLIEFVQYLINEGLNTNEHWTPVYDLCYPCAVNYTFIGKYEHLSEDSEALLDIIEAPPVRFPMTNSAHTRLKVREYFQMLPLKYMQALYRLYRNDFIIFDYNLESVLGYDFG